MTAQLHLAGPDDLDRLLTMSAAFHEEEGIALSETHRRTAFEPLLKGAPQGAVYLIGPQRAPVGYLVLGFSWSIVQGGMTAWIDEIFLRPAVRGRGLGRDAISAMARTLSQADVRSLYLDVRPGNTDAAKLYKKLGFQPRDTYVTLVKHLS